jgi:hypothetical protein
MASCATKLFEARNFMLFVVGAVDGLYLRDYVHGSEQRDAAFESFAHSFAAFVESQLAGSAHGVAIVAVMDVRKRRRRVLREICRRGLRPP